MELTCYTEFVYCFIFHYPSIQPMALQPIVEPWPAIYFT
jgi:hypothetical protein